MIIIRSHPRNTEASFLRSFIFGVEDGLVSTVGLISGVAFAGVPRATILLTGFVLIFVEAFSMAISSLLSEQSSEEFVERRALPLLSFASSSAVMFFSYLIAGIVPLLPYLIITPESALWISISMSLAALFFLGLLNAKLLKIPFWRHGLEMLLLGGVAIIVGVLVGQVVHSL
ncbi:MAG: VIT1/CCC1 transporter family protein [bacterium]|nr:VIT1/CCC1 transporter family protein [bacterium]